MLLNPFLDLCIGEGEKTMKIIKSITLIGLIIILAFINFAYAEKENLKDEDLFIKVFEETEANFSSLNLNFNGTINELYKDEKQLKEMMRHISKELGLKEHQDSFYICEEEYMNSQTEAFDSSQVVMHGNDKDNNEIIVILYSYLDKESNTGETSIVIDVTIKGDYNKIKAIKKRIEDLYKVYNVKTEFTYCIIGTFKAELNKEDMIKKVTKALSASKAKKVEGLIENDIISISAYSPNLDRFIYTGNKKMNLNIALSYNEYEGKTYIFMGYPIIAIGY